MEITNLEELDKHYGDFTDAVISKIVFEQNDYGTTAVLHLSSRLVSTERNQYDSIVISFFNVEEIEFIQPFRGTSFRPWAGNSLKFEDKYIFGFEPFNENLKSVEEIKKSNFYIICKSFVLESVPKCSVLD